MTFSTGLSPPLTVDVRAELAPYFPDIDRFTDKLLAPSPFRYDKHPSFMVRLETSGEYPAGVWADLGASDPEWRSGSFTKLLAFLRNETLAETDEYLSARYGIATEDMDVIPLRIPNLSSEETLLPLTLPESALEPYRYRSPYLAERGITEAVQRLYDVGYDRRRRAITLPWRLPDGRLANVKYRRVGEKTFWYAKGGRPIRELLYGIHVVYRRNIRKVALVEAEIDALSLAVAGVPAIATGGATFTSAKRDMLIRSPAETVVLIRDRDGAGRQWQKRIVAELLPYMSVQIARIPRGYKDANDVLKAEGPEGLRRIAVEARGLRRKLIRLNSTSAVGIY